MARPTFPLAVAIIVAFGGFVSAQTTPKTPRTPWANKLFLSGILDDEAKAKAEAPATIEHDFGVVPFGTLCTKTFSFTNIYDVPLQVVDVRTDCGCLKAFPPQKVLQPYEEAEFTVTMATASFKGKATKKLLVSVGPNYFSTAELVLKATSRDDATLTPGQVDFGIVAQGKASEKSLALRYTGKDPKWAILKASSSNPSVTVDARETARGFLGIDYTIAVNLKDDSASGTLNELLTLTTNDPTTPVIAIAVGGKVTPPVSVSPARVEFKGIKPGSVATAKVLLSAKADCKVTAIADDGDGLSLETFDGQRQMHVLTVKYEAKAGSGPMKKQFAVKTSLPGVPETIVEVEVK